MELENLQFSICSASERLKWFKYSKIAKVYRLTYAVWSNNVNKLFNLYYNNASLNILKTRSEIYFYYYLYERYFTNFLFLGIE